MTAFRKDVRLAYAAGLMRHLAFHSAYIPPPQRYLVALPEGRYGQVQDFAFKGRRRLVTYGMRPIVGGRVMTGDLMRPKKASQDGPWFANMLEREQNTTLDFFEGWLHRAWDGAETVHDDTAVLIEPLTEPERVDLAELLTRREDGQAWLR